MSQTCARFVEHLRTRQAFARGHLQHVQLRPPGAWRFTLGWLLPWNTPLTLIGESPEQVAQAQRELVRIGIDRPAAQATAPVAQLADDRPLSRFGAR